MTEKKRFASFFSIIFFITLVGAKKKILMKSFGGYTSKL